MAIVAEIEQIPSRRNSRLKSRARSEIARCLGVPLGVLMQSGSLTHGTAVEELRAFASISLGSFARRFEDELTAKLLTDSEHDAGWVVEFDLRTLLMSPAELPDRLSKLVNGGSATTNEAREQLGLPYVDDGDELRIPVDIAPMDRSPDGNTGAATQPRRSAKRSARGIRPRDDAARDSLLKRDFFLRGLRTDYVQD